MCQFLVTVSVCVHVKTTGALYNVLELSKERATEHTQWHKTRHTRRTRPSLTLRVLDHNSWCCHSQIHPFSSEVVVEAWGMRKK